MKFRALLLLFFVIVYSTLKGYSQSVFIKVKNNCNNIQLTLYDDELSTTTINYTSSKVDTLIMPQKSISAIITFSLKSKPWNTILLTQPGDSVEISVNDNCAVNYKFLNESEYYRIREREYKNFTPNIDTSFINRIQKAEKKKDYVEVEKLNNLGYINKAERIKYLYKNYMSSELVDKKIKLLDIESISNILRFKSKNNIISDREYLNELVKILKLSSDSSISSIPLVYNNLIYQLTLAKKWYSFSSAKIFELIKTNLKVGYLQKRIIMQELKSTKNQIEFDSVSNYFLQHYNDSASFVFIKNLKDFNFSTQKDKKTVMFNINKEKISLDSLLNNQKKEFVFIDFWASWCHPCISEFSKSRILAEKYKKYIDFIYISIDDNFDAWKKAVFANTLSNAYLLSGKVFIYKNNVIKVTGVPRYLLINKEGRIVNNDAPRPSDNALGKLFDKMINR